MKIQEERIIPLHHTIWAVYANKEEMLKGNLIYYKNKVLAVNVDRLEYLEMARDGIDFFDSSSSEDFIGFYEDHELDTEDFIADLEAYANKL